MEHNTPATTAATLQTRIPLRLRPHDNVLKNIHLKEPIDLTLLDKLIHCPSLLKDTFHDPLSSSLYKGGEVELLRHYRKNWRQAWVDVQYTRNEKIDYGRFLPSRARGLHNIRRELRHTLAGEMMVDVDVANAHPKIMQQIKNIHGIEGDYIDAYCGDRENWLKTVVDDYQLNTHPNAENEPSFPREMAKTLFIILAYGGGTTRWKAKYKMMVKNEKGEDTTDVKWEINKIPDPPNIKNYKADTRRLQARITEANPHLKQQVIDLKEEYSKGAKYNLNGSVTSYYLQEWESRILEVMYRYCLEKKYIHKAEVVLCADGIMLMKKHYHDGIPAELEVEIERRLGFQVKLEQKAMKSAYTPKQIEAAQDFKLEEGTFLTGRVANVFRILYSNKFIYTDGALRRFNGVYWEKEGGASNTTLHDFVNTTFHLYLTKKLFAKSDQLVNELQALIAQKEACNLDGEKKTIDDLIKLKQENIKEVRAKIGDADQHCRNIRKRRDLVADIIHAITNPYILWDDHPYKLAFTNRIIDIRTGEVIPSDYRDYLSMTTTYDWDGYDLRERVSEVKLILQKILPDRGIRNYYMTALSTGLYGQQQENLFIATGVGGNGKTMLNGLMLNAMGDYGYDMPKSVLQDEKKGGADPEVAKLHKRRFVLTTEPSKNKKIQTSIMKKLTGDQSVEARLLYENGLKGGIALVLSMFLEANQLPTLDEITEGINRRIDVFPFQARFLKTSDVARLTKGMTEEQIKASNLHVGDTKYKKNDWKADHRQALIIILLEYFQIFHKNGECMPEQPKACENAKRDYMSSSDDLFSWFDDKYDRIPEGKEDEYRVIKLSDLYQSFKQSDYFSKQTRDTQKRYTKRDNFYTDLNENLFINVFIGKRHTVADGKQQRTPYIKGWRDKPPDEKDDDEEEEDEEWAAEEKPMHQRGY